MKKIIMLMMICVIYHYNTLAVSTWDGISSSIWINGNGTSNNPFLIENASNLAYLAQSVNNGNKYIGISFKMNDDIDLNGEFWTPIGISSSKYFSGTFDGDGHTISNLFINTSTIQYCGLFGYLKNANINNIGITGNWSITNNSSFSTTRYTGGISGYAYSSNFINCFNSQEISSKVNSSTFEDCYIGGIVGYASFSSSFTNCFNTSSIYGEAFSNSNTSYSNPINNVYCAICFVGGISGFITDSVKIINCYNTGFVKGVTSSFGSMYCSDTRVGGVVGEANRASYIYNCNNTGSIITTCNDGNNCYIGGIVGCASYISILESENKGVVSGSLTNINGNSGGLPCYVGGILGYVHNSLATIKNCNNKGALSSISSKKNCCVGGILGNADYSASAILLNCYNTSNINCTAYPSPFMTIVGAAGGLVGFISSNSDYIKITNSYNLGNITCNAPSIVCGGIIGGIYTNAYITNSYNAGSISGSGSNQYLGPLLGYSNSNVTINNSYFLNNCALNSTNLQGISKLSSYMKSLNFVSDLNNATLVWQYDSNLVNNGYPILSAIYVSQSLINIPAIFSNPLSIAVTSNSTWTATSDQSWLTISPNTSITGNGILNIIASPNQTLSNRLATITVSVSGFTTKTIIVIQSGSLSSKVFDDYSREVVFYPNPANKSLFINLPEHTYQQNTTVSIYNIQGQQLLQQNMYQSQTEIDIQNLSKGIYIIKVINGNEVIQGKFVKE